MLESQFLIIGPDDGAGEQQYWSNHLEGWTTDVTEATTFDYRILTAPLPPEGTGIMEFVDSQPVRFLERNPSPSIGDTQAYENVD